MREGEIGEKPKTECKFDFAQSHVEAIQYSVQQSINSTYCLILVLSFLF